MTFAGIVGLVAYVLWYSTLFYHIHAELQCPASNGLPIKLSLNSKQNQSGHWISQVGLQRSGVRGQRMTSVVVEHSSSSCAGVESSNMVLTFTAPPPRVGTDYEFFADLGYYKFHNDATTWPLARQVCADEGSHLAIINSEKEANVMITLFSRFNVIAGSIKNVAWIGTHRIGEEHFSILGESLNATGFSRWSPGEPNRGGEYCVLVNRANGGLVDISCEFKAAFICEQEI